MHLRVGQFFFILSILPSLATAAEPVSPPTAKPNSTSDTAEFTANAREDYFNRYSRQKFAPFLARIPTSVSPETRATLSAILALRENVLTNARTKALASGQTIAAYQQQQIDMIHARLLAEVGADLAERFDRYLKSLPQRQLLADVNQVLSYQDAGLTAQQLDRLCELFSNREVPITHSLTAAEFDQILKKKETAYVAIVSEAAKFLSGLQDQALRDKLDLLLAQLRMNRSGLVHGSVATP